MVWKSPDNASDELLSKTEVASALKDEIAKHGTVASFLQANSLTGTYSTQYISDVVNLRRTAGETILNILQMEKVTTYKKRWR